jgi:radical SAM superfamily enzyme YgiQ (UPF0313 family)
MADLRPGLGAIRDRLRISPLLFDGQAEEFGNPAWEAAPIRIAIARLSPFEDVSRSTPHLFLFQACRAALPGAFVDFSFFPSAQDRQLLYDRGLPLGFGIASLRSLPDFDIILISNSYTLELVNLAYLLANSGLSATRGQGKDGREPLIVLGGSNASAASSVFSDPAVPGSRSLVDALFFGEGEPQVAALVSALGKIDRSGPGFSGAEKVIALRDACRAAEGLFYPGKEGATLQARESDRRPASGPSRPEPLGYPILNSEEASNYKLSLGCGCPSFCTFCMESWDRKPYRERSRAGLEAEAAWAKRTMGASGIELSSFNFNAHSEIVPLILRLSRTFMRLGAMSQRADILQATQGLVNFEFAMGKRSFTIGVEGISERMRRYYAKELDEPLLNALLKRLTEAGAREIKLFYIISGLETEADVNEFQLFVKNLKAMRKASSEASRIVFSSGYLTRMPGTPLEFAPLCLDEPSLRRVAGPVKAACDTNGFEFRLPAYFDEYALTQVIALGGSSIFDLLLELAASGMVYDKNLSRGAWELAHGRLSEQGFLSPSFLGEKDLESRLPLDFMSLATDRAFRYGRYQNSLLAFSSPRVFERDREAPSCLSGACIACGACAQDDSARLAILAHRIKPASLSDIEAAAAIVKEKALCESLYAWISVPAKLHGATPEFLAAYHLREILRHAPGQTDNILDCEEILLSGKDGRERFPAFSGLCLIRLRAYKADAVRSLIPSMPGFELAREPIPNQPRIEEAGVSVFFAPGSALGAQALEKCLSAYLARELVPHTLTRREGASHWIVAKQGLKKRVVSQATLEMSAEGPVLRMSVLSRFSFALFRDVFSEAHPEEPFIRMRIESISRIGS